MAKRVVAPANTITAYAHKYPGHPIKSSSQQFQALAPAEQLLELLASPATFAAPNTREMMEARFGHHWSFWMTHKPTNPLDQLHSAPADFPPSMAPSAAWPVRAKPQQ